MTTYSTAYSAYPLGRWLATLAVSLVLLALAYAHAPNPAEYLGLSSPDARPMPMAHGTAPAQPGGRFAAAQAPALAATQLEQHPDPTR